MALSYSLYLSLIIIRKSSFKQRTSYSLEYKFVVQNGSFFLWG